MLEASNTATELASLASETRALKFDVPCDSATRRPEGAID
jgi:hypothetical protein